MMLALLQVLHVFWFMMIASMIFRMLFGYVCLCVNMSLLRAAIQLDKFTYQKISPFNSTKLTDTRENEGDEGEDVDVDVTDVNKSSKQAPSTVKLEARATAAAGAKKKI